VTSYRASFEGWRMPPSDKFDARPARTVTGPFEIEVFQSGKISKPVWKARIAVTQQELRGTVGKTAEDVQRIIESMFESRVSEWRQESR
jgi:hypothetical protein